MSPAEFAAIRSRAAKATPGPWWARLHGGKVVAIESAPTPILENAASHGLDPLEVGENDADFIAAARMDIPALLEEIDLLRDALVYLQKEAEVVLSKLPTTTTDGIPELQVAVAEIDYLSHPRSDPVSIMGHADPVAGDGYIPAAAISK